MNPRSVDTKTVLCALEKDPSFHSCLVANAEKQLYTLEVLRLDAQNLRVELEAPIGRANPINLSKTWELRFRDKDGVYQANVVSIAEKDRSLVFTLKNNLCFLARRNNIRFSADSRNPNAIAFNFQGQRYCGILIDFSLDGMGIQVARDVPLEVGSSVTDAQFELRSCPVQLSRGRIAYLKLVDGFLRAGIQFVEIPADERRAIHLAFDRWHRSQSPSFSMDCDG